MTGAREAGPDSAPPPRRWQRWMGVALVASLALNLLVLAAIATVAWRHRHWDRALGRPNVLHFTRTLEDGRRTQLLEAARAERQQLRPFWASLRQAREEVRAALAAVPFNPARYQRANEALLTAEIEARRHAHAFFDTIVLKLSPDERARLARWLARAERVGEGHRRWRSRWSDRQEDGEGGGAPAAGPTKPAAAPKP